MKYSVYLTCPRGADLTLLMVSLLKAGHKVELGGKIEASSMEITRISIDDKSGIFPLVVNQDMPVPEATKIGKAFTDLARDKIPSLSSFVVVIPYLARLNMNPGANGSTNLGTEVSYVSYYGIISDDFAVTPTAWSQLDQEFG